jgi:arylsulfatase A-like enzyme
VAQQLVFSVERRRDMSTPLSVVLVTVDCLRADHVGFLGYGRPTTPFLDSLADESFVVPNAIVGGVPTYYSFPVILASRHPLAMGRDLIGIAPGETSLPSYLKQSGYATAAFTAANPYVSPKFGYDQGFDTFRDFLDRPVTTFGTGSRSASSGGMRTRLNRALERFSRRLGPMGAIYDELYFQYCQSAGPEVQSLDSLRPYPAADVIVDNAREWLTPVCSVPFFLWLHLMDPHAPYYPAEEVLRSFGKSAVTPWRARYLNSYWNRSDLGPDRLRTKRGAVVDLYDAGIRWVDLQLSRLVEILKKSRVWDRCAFVVTADHGEEFLEHGARFHAPGPMKEELIRVPLMVRVPGVSGREVGKNPFSHLDLGPTLLDAMNLPVPGDFQGRSRWGAWQRREELDEPVIVDSAECTNPNRPELRLAPRVLCVRDARYKLIIRFGSGEEHLFDLHSDPSEQNPLPVDTQKPVRKRLMTHASEHIRRTQRVDRSEYRLRARLRDLRTEFSKSMSTL